VEANEDAVQRRPDRVTVAHEYSSREVASVVGAKSSKSLYDTSLSRYLMTALKAAQELTTQIRYTIHKWEGTQKCDSISLHTAFKRLHKAIKTLRRIEAMKSAYLTDTKEDLKNTYEEDLESMNDTATVESHTAPGFLDALTSGISFPLKEAEVARRALETMKSANGEE
jgi:lipopolysaccharide biosynthesis regulator YciM